MTDTRTSKGTGEKTPSCPYCKADDVLAAVTWTAQSDEPCDSANAATLEEYQCAACGLSFWLPVVSK